LSFFQVHRMRRAQVRPRVSLTHGSRHSAPCARRLGPHVGRVSISWVADQSDRPNCYVCYVCEGWHGKGLDEPAAERMLQYFRRQADGAPEDDQDPEWEAAIAFFLDHGQCLDWIFFGDPGGMITGAVARSARAEEIA
jgi:hypothetical protein